ncbi:MAG: ROK family protein [Lentisphaeria bacterium]|nr:ROK family protein [Lentisphaeria bacterium]
MNRRAALKKQILRYLLLRRRATRPELVALTGTRAATVFEAIGELKEAGLVAEPERRGKSTGRRAPGLVISPNCFHTLGVQLHPSGGIGVVIDGSGRMIGECRTEAEFRGGLGEVKRAVLLLLQQLRDRAGDDWAAVRGLGFTGMNMERDPVRPGSIPVWRDADAIRYLEGVSGLPAGVWPERMVRAKWEYQRLPGEHSESVFHLSAACGFEGGFIRNGEYFAGDSGRAMEIGHLTVDPAGPLCDCGRRGCLDAVAGMAALERSVAAARVAGVDLGGMPEPFSMAAFAEFVGKNPAVRAVAEELCRNLGRALGAVVTLLDPGRIVISGEMTRLGDFLLESLRRELESHCCPETARKLRITLAQSADTDTARGVAMMMREKLLLES